MKIVRLQSNIAITVFGPNKPKAEDIKLDKDGKYESIKPQWQSKKGYRVDIRIGANDVPAYVLEWGMVKSCIKLGKMTADTAGITAADKKMPKETKSKTKSKGKKSTKKVEELVEEVIEEVVETVEEAINPEGLPEVK